MPTDLTTAEKAEKLGMRKCATPDCSCGGRYWIDGEGIGFNAGEVERAYARKFGDGTAPDYRAALEALVGAGDHFLAAVRTRPGELALHMDAPAFSAALTHARKVLQ